MEEIVSIHVGQAGCRIGDTCWQLFCLEHGIDPGGSFIEQGDSANDCLNTFFHETASGKSVPRAVFVDLEETVVDEVKRGPIGDLYKSDQFVTGKEDAASSYSRGHYSIGREHIDETMDKIRKQMEQCSEVQGFVVYHSMAGGTGSGFTSLLLQEMYTEYKKATKMSISVFPSQKA